MLLLEKAIPKIRIEKDGQNEENAVTCPEVPPTHSLIMKYCQMILDKVDAAWYSLGYETLKCCLLAAIVVARYFVMKNPKSG